jgi:hypothetical protein
MSYFDRYFLETSHRRRKEEIESEIAGRTLIKPRKERETRNQKEIRTS